MTGVATFDEDELALFLLAGQSNMAGRAPVEEIDKAIVSGIWALGEDGHWRQAYEPLHYDLPEKQGVGPGFAFAREILNTGCVGEAIGLVPAAVGGTRVIEWMPGHPRGCHEETVRRVGIACESGLLRGILWQQGESDIEAGSIEDYGIQLAKVLESFRQRLELPELPIVVGGLPAYLLSGRAVELDRSIRSVADGLRGCLYVPGCALGHIGDCLHYNTDSQREVGYRYALAMQALLEWVKR